MENRAHLATVHYIKTITEILEIEPDHTGRLSCNLPNQLVIQNLALSLHDCMDGESFIDSINDASAIAREEVLSCAYGLADDLIQMTKLGFLCGDKVVLWDFLWGRVMRGALVNEINPNLVSSIGLDLAKLLPLAEAGGLYILPHPVAWSDDAVSGMQRLQLMGGYTPKFQGIVCALGARASGLWVNPYTLHADPTDDWAERLYSGDCIEHSYTASLSQMLLDEEIFPDLHNADIVTLYNTVGGASGRCFRGLLRDAVHPKQPLQTRQQFLDYSRDLQERLKRELSSHKNKVERACSRASSAFGMVSASITLISYMYSKDQGVALASGIFTGFTAAAFQLLTEMRSKSEGNELHQVFRILSYDDGTKLQLPQ